MGWRGGQGQKLGLGPGAHLVVVIIQMGVLALQLNHLYSDHPVLLFPGHEVSIGVRFTKPRLLGRDTSSQQKHPFKGSPAIVASQREVNGQ